MTARTPAGQSSARQSTALQEEARHTYRQSLAAEMPLSGRKLGEMFGRSERWGRERIAEVKAELVEEELPATRQDSGKPQVSAGVLAARQENGTDGAGPADDLSAGSDNGSTTAAPAVEEAGFRDVAATAKRVLSAAAIARLTAARQERQRGRVPTAAKVVAALAASLSLGAALAISYVELAALARAAGMGEHLSWMMPLTADGLLMTGLVTAWVRVQRGDRAGFRPFLALLVGGSATVAGNVAARWFAVDTSTGVELWPWIPPVMAGYVPVAAALAAEQALALIRGKHER